MPVKRKAEDEPGHGDFDVVQRALGGVALAAEAAEDAGEGPPQGPPLKGQRQQPADHQHRGPRPERPGADVAEAADRRSAPLRCQALDLARSVRCAESADSAGWSAGRESLASQSWRTALRWQSISTLLCPSSTRLLTLTTPCSGLGEPSCNVGAFRSRFRSARSCVDRGPRPGIAEDAGAYGGGKLGIGFQLFGRGKLGPRDGLFKLDGERLPGLDRQRQLRRRRRP